MKRTTIALLTALALTPMAASAADVSYSYIEGGYLRVDPDDIGSEDGFGGRGSGAITDNIHVFGGFDRVQIDVGNRDFDLDQLRFGIGYNTPISNNVDFVGRVAYERIDADDIDDGNGFSVEAGVRGAFSQNFEGSAAIRYTDIEDGDDTQLVLGGQYKFNPTWGINAEVALSNDGNAFFIGPRVSF